MAISCNKEEVAIKETNLEQKEKNYLTNGFLGEEENEVIDVYDLMVAHFENTRTSDLSMYLHGEEENELVAQIIELCEDFGENTTFASSLDNLASEYEIDTDLITELNLFNVGLINKIHEDVYSVADYYITELSKDRSLNHNDNYILQQVIKGSHGVWHVILKDLGILPNDGINTRDDDPLCIELVESLGDRMDLINAGIAIGAISGTAIGAFVGGPIGALAGSGIGALVGGIAGWFKGDSIKDRQYDQCEDCIPPTSLFTVSQSGCSLNFSCAPVGTGSNVTSLFWSSAQTIPTTVIGTRSQNQIFQHILGSGPVTMNVTASCVIDGNPVTLTRIVLLGDIEQQQLNVPSNAFFMVGNDAININVENGQVGSPVTETYQYRGLAVEDPGTYDYEFLSITNGTVVSSTSSSITVRWYPEDPDYFVLQGFVWGELTFRVTNNCTGGESKIINLNTMIYAGEPV